MKSSTDPKSRTPLVPKRYEHLVEDFISLPSLAEKLGLARKTVRRLLEKAGICSYVFGPHRTSTVRYSKADVNTFLERCYRSQKRAG